MLTVTTAAECAQLTISSDSSATNLIEAKLEITYNCSTTVTKTAVAGPFTILPADFNATEKLCDGIYSIKYTSTYSTGTKIVEYKCHLVDCSLHCDVTNTYATTRDSEALRLYQVLKMGLDCSDCDCELLCDIYLELTTTKVTNNCGC